ncbi:MAG: excinuclease ABC subunit UvrB [bacterium]
MDFKLVAPYKPAGDQPKAIEKLTEGIERGLHEQTLLGVTGSGKTYTIANVIKNIGKPTLVIAHNKTLAAQLCNEFREFFPENAVEYFVSYYDYYQPEAYIARSDTFIEKEAMINEEIDRLRHAATAAALTRKDCIIVASVSCIYGLGAPEEYRASLMHLARGQVIVRGDLMRKLLAMQFKRRTGTDLVRGSFRVRGDVLELVPMDEETVYRITLEEQTIKEILQIDPVTRKTIKDRSDVYFYPAKHFITAPADRERAIKAILAEKAERVKHFEKKGMTLEAERLERRTNEDVAMIRETGFCGGIENYSRHLSGRGPGEAPDTLISYFPKGEFLTVIDESHVTIPQIGGMFNGDQSRKKTLIDYGFRLPSAADNRPLKYDEFMKRVGQLIYVSATPGDPELQNSAQVVEQIVRPTGLVDPEILILPITGDEKKGIKTQVEDLMARARERVAMGDRVLVTTLTKKMAEDLSEYLAEQKIRVKYLHSDIDTLERIEIISALRRGEYDVLVGVNLLREGLDLPEVSLVAILDADKEGFLRSETSLIQTIGRAARNVRGQVVLYADNMTGSMKRALSETDRRRKVQLEYNRVNNITPRSIEKKIHDISSMLRSEKDAKANLKLEMKAETHDLEKVIAHKEKEMKSAAKALEFELAGLLRDEIAMLAAEMRKREHAPVPRPKKPFESKNPFLKKRR